MRRARPVFPSRGEPGRMSARWRALGDVASRVMVRHPDSRPPFPSSSPREHAVHARRCTVAHHDVCCKNDVHEEGTSLFVPTH